MDQIRALAVRAEAERRQKELEKRRKRKREQTGERARRKRGSSASSSSSDDEKQVAMAREKRARGQMLSEAEARLLLTAERQKAGHSDQPAGPFQKRRNARVAPGELVNPTGPGALGLKFGADPKALPKEAWSAPALAGGDWRGKSEKKGRMVVDMYGGHKRF